MKISSLKSGRVTDLIWVTFNNGQFIPLFIDDVVRLHLVVGHEIDPDNYQSLVSTSLIYLLRNYALRQIAISPKIESVLRPKLNLRLRQYCQKYHYQPSSSPEIINEIISYLQQKQLLDDHQFVSYLIKRNQHHSQNYLIRLLKHFGLNPTDYPDTQKSDLPLLKKLIAKKLLSINGLPDYKTKNKIISALARQGFAVSDIKNIIGDLSDSLIE